MQVLKSFMRDGILYTSGADLPPDLDTVTINHYRHHGMIGEPAESKPAPSRRRASSKPAETKPAEPQQQLSADDGVHTSAQPPEASPAATPAEGEDPLQVED